MGWQSTELDFYFTCIAPATLLSEQESFDPKRHKMLYRSVVLKKKIIHLWFQLIISLLRINNLRRQFLFQLFQSYVFYSLAV